MIRGVLIALFTSVLFIMITVTAYASAHRSILNLSPQLTSDPWFHATLLDAYFGFLTFFVWVAYKESRVWSRSLWFILIMLLGNIAMAVYMLKQLREWDASRGPASLLLRQD